MADGFNPPSESDLRDISSAVNSKPF